MSVKDMYADLEKIEARGKRKKEKRKGLFSSLGKKDEQKDAAPEPAPAPPETPAPAMKEPVRAPPPEPPKSPPVTEEDKIVQSLPPESPAPIKEEQKPVKAPPPAPTSAMKEPVQPPPPETPAPSPVMKEPVRAPPPEPPNAPPTEETHQSKAHGWKPLTGGNLKKAQEELVSYKKWLNSGFKAGVLTKQHCVEMVRKKEIELKLRPPE